MRIVITSEARATAHTSKKLDIWLSIWYNGYREWEWDTTGSGSATPTLPLQLPASKGLQVNYGLEMT